MFCKDTTGWMIKREDRVNDPRCTDVLGWSLLLAKGGDSQWQILRWEIIVRSMIHEVLIMWSSRPAAGACSEIRTKEREEWAWKCFRLIVSCCWNLLDGKRLSAERLVCLCDACLFDVWPLLQTYEGYVKRSNGVYFKQMRQAGTWAVWDGLKRERVASSSKFRKQCVFAYMSLEPLCTNLAEAWKIGTCSCLFGDLFSVDAAYQFLL